MAGFVMLRWQAPMIAVAAGGLPLLYLTYLSEIDVRRAVSRRSLAMTALIGLVLGVGWAYLAGTVFADGYDVALGSEANAGPTLWYGLAASMCEALLMLVPAALVRVVSRSTRESLVGFLIGSLGATAFTAAATLTLLAPQLATGPVAADRSLGGLVVEAGIQGVAMPLVSVAAGGIFGVALWFRRPIGASHRQYGPVAAAVAVVSVLFAGLGLLDASPFPNSVYVAGYLLIALLALLALRIAVQATLLREAPDGADLGEQMPCAACDHVVEQMAFCPSCGVASATARRPARAPRRVLGAMAAGVCAAVALAVVASMLMSPGIAPYRCPPDCGAPPLGTPVETNPRFSAVDGSFSVSYPGKGSAYKATFNPDGLNGIVLNYLGGDTGTLALFGEPARDRTPQEIARDLINEKYPDATIAYEIPNASVGYQPGYGVAADEYPESSNGRFARLRILVMVAVKHDYALIAAAVGPYHRFSPDYGSGLPSGANLELAMDIGKYVNSFRWAGDRHTRLQ